jgi:hypothetical protein
MKLPPRLAEWFRALRRAHERQEKQHLRAMSKANPWRAGRRVPLPPPPGGYNKGGSGRRHLSRPRRFQRAPLLAVIRAVGTYRAAERETSLMAKTFRAHGTNSSRHEKSLHAPNSAMDEGVIHVPQGVGCDSSGDGAPKGAALAALAVPHRHDDTPRFLLL